MGYEIIKSVETYYAALNISLNKDLPMEVKASLHEFMQTYNNTQIEDIWTSGNEIQMEVSTATGSLDVSAILAEFDKFLVEAFEKENNVANDFESSTEKRVFLTTIDGSKHTGQLVNLPYSDSNCLVIATRESINVKDIVEIHTI